MNSAVVAFAFGVPNTLRSNRRIAEMASDKAKNLGVPVYTQLEVVPLERGVETVLTEELPPNRVPTLRIARGAVKWAQQGNVNEFWLCAATPHLPRCRRDLSYAIQEANARITVRIVEDTRCHPDEFWFCPESSQPDTRKQLLWAVRDGILMHLPMRLYSAIAS